MIRFKKNGNTVTVVEDVIEFKATLNNSIDAAVKLAGGNPYQAIELYTRFNSPGEFAILVKAENFERIKYGYGYNQDGKSMKIAPVLLSNNTVKFIAFIPRVNTKCGHIIPIMVEDGDILSDEPLDDLDKFSDEDSQLLAAMTRILNSEVPATTYQSELFKLTNLLVKKGYPRKEAYRLAKERLINFAPDEESQKHIPTPQTRIFEKKPEIKGDRTIEENRKSIADEYQKCIIAEIERLKKYSNMLNSRRFKGHKGEKHVDPTPPSMKAAEVLVNVMNQAFEDVFGFPLF